MFKGCTSLTNASSLTIKSCGSDSMYGSMFEGCTSLTTAPTTILLNNTEYIGELGFASMFKDCTSLTTAPRFTCM